MKWIICLCNTLCLFATQSALAEIPVTISNPSPAIAESYNVGDSTTFTYTITNNVPNKSFPVSVSGTSGPVSRTIVAGDCGSSLPKGPSTCKIGILIAPVASNSGQSYNQNLSVNYQGRTPLVKNIMFSVTSSIASGTAILTAAGSTGPALLADSTNGGNDWAVKPVSGVPISSTFNAAACTGNGSTAICTAAGRDFTGGNPPLLAVSIDGGNSWAVKSVTGLPADGLFSATSCTGTGSTAICIAAGLNNTGATILAASTDGANTWAVKSVTGIPVDGNFHGSSCTGSGSSAVCTAAGQNTTGNQPPLLAASTDGGNSWAVKPIGGLPISGYFNATSCTGNGSTAICTAAGQGYISSNPPLLAVSIDGGNTWAVTSVTGLPATGLFSATSCTGNGSTAICTAAGQDATGTAPPLLAISSDGGNTWATKSVTGLPITGAFFGTSCTGSGATAICIAAGQSTTGGTSPLLAVSHDGGNSWAVKSVAGSPLAGVFTGASCTGNGPTAACTAVGQDGTNSPFLAVSINGGNTWEVKNVTGLSGTGVFNASAATGGS